MHEMAMVRSVVDIVLEEAEHAAKFAELLGEVVTDSTKKNLEMRVDAENGAGCVFDRGLFSRYRRGRVRVDVRLDVPGHGGGRGGAPSDTSALHGALRGVRPHLPGEYAMPGYTPLSPMRSLPLPSAQRHGVLR